MLLSLLCAGVVMAQREYEPHFSWGARAGMTMGKMAFSPTVKQGWVSGFTAGAVARYSEENHVGIIAELNISQRGWKEDFEEFSTDYSYQRHLTYLQLPLMTHIYFGNPSRLRGFINMGPVIGYMIGSSISSNFDYQAPDLDQMPAFQDHRTPQMSMEITGKFDYGITVGLGAERNLFKNQSILLEARFYYGLGNIFPCAKKDYFSAARGMALEVTLGWMVNH